jgi:hypothetical protein
VHVSPDGHGSWRRDWWTGWRRAPSASGADAYS